MDNIKGSIYIPNTPETNNRRPAYVKDDVTYVSPDAFSAWRVATPEELASFVPGDNYPGTNNQRWWNAQFDN